MEREKALNILMLYQEKLKKLYEEQYEIELEMHKLMEKYHVRMSEVVKQGNGKETRDNNFRSDLR
jgi:hypothetical protein